MTVALGNNDNNLGEDLVLGVAVWSCQAGCRFCLRIADSGLPPKKLYCDVLKKKSGGLFFNSGEFFQVKKKREKHNLTLSDVKDRLLLTSMT